MWTRDNIRQIVTDLALKATGQPFVGDSSFYKQNGADWKDTFGLDSVEFMGLAAAVNSFFNLFELADPPYLLSSTKTDDWVEMVFKARQMQDDALTFHTSGTSGKSKTTRHTLPYLKREIDFLGSLFAGATCVIPYVPSNSIYGFLCTVGLPQHLGIPVIYPSDVNWQQLPPNALIVATPFNWQYILNTLPAMQLNCLGVSAAAPLYNSLSAAIIGKGVRLIELYGSTETSGIGYRTNHTQPFTLMPFWELESGNLVTDLDSGNVCGLMDDIELSGAGKFNVLARKDKQVKIAGKLVDLTAVSAVITKMPNVKTCTLSAKATGNDTLLQAELQLNEDGEQQRADIKALIRRSLPAHEKPRDIYFS